MLRCLILFVPAVLTSPLRAGLSVDWQYDCPTSQYSRNVAADDYDIGKINHDYYAAPAFDAAYFIVYERSLQDPKTGYTLYRFGAAGVSDIEVYYVIGKKHVIVSRFLGSPATPCKRKYPASDAVPETGS